MSCPYVEGQTIVVVSTFRDLADALVNPDTVTALVEAPDGTQTTPTPVNQSTGIYHTTVTMDQSGWWKIRVEGTTDEGTAVCETKCCARPSSITETSPDSP